MKKTYRNHKGVTATVIREMLQEGIDAEMEAIQKEIDEL